MHSSPLPCYIVAIRPKRLPSAPYSRTHSAYVYEITILSVYELMCLQMSGFKSADFHDFSYKCDAIGGYLKERHCAFITETNYLGNNRSLLYESAGTHTHTNWKYAEYFSAQPGGPYTITVNYKSNDVKVRLGLSLCTP